MHPLRKTEWRTPMQRYTMPMEHDYEITLAPADYRLTLSSCGWSAMSVYSRSLELIRIINLIRLYRNEKSGKFRNCSTLNNPLVANMSPNDYIIELFHFLKSIHILESEIKNL